MSFNQRSIYQTGVTLIELMLALLLSTLILSGLFQLYVTLHKHIQLQSDMRHIQFTAYSVLTTLREDLKHAVSLDGKNKISLENNGIKLWRTIGIATKKQEIQKHYYLKNNGLYVKINQTPANEIASGVKQMIINMNQQTLHIQFEFVTTTLSSIWFLSVHLR